MTKKCEIFWAPESDHSAVAIHLQSQASAQQKGSGFWKFNTSLLEDETYIAALRENLQSFKTKYDDLPDLGLKWDLIKVEMRGFTVQYSKRKARMLRDKEISLQKKVNMLLEQAEKNPHDKNIKLELQVEKSRLKKFMTHRTNGAILRSKVRWHEDGERNTKCFYGLEKRSYTNKAIAMCIQCVDRRSILFSR